MRYTDDRLLLMPPKTASRWCQESVAGHVANIGGPDAVRHAALHQLPPEVRDGREVYCLTRDPFRWYESWWAHMKRQKFAWSRQWGHDPVPSFRDALRDYCFGWQQRVDGSPLVSDAGAPGNASGSTDHIANQATLGCGWWSYLMRWTVGRTWDTWNNEARWVFTGDSLAGNLSAAGFVAQQRSLG